MKSSFRFRCRSFRFERIAKTNDVNISRVKADQSFLTAKDAISSNRKITDESKTRENAYLEIFGITAR